MTEFPSSVMTGATPDPDDELVAAWDRWRAEWFAYWERGGVDDSRMPPLDRKLLETPANGLRGVAAKAAHVLWHAITAEDKRDMRCGLHAPEKDMDYHILCIHRLGLELERMTGIVVSPVWDNAEDEGGAS